MTCVSVFSPVLAQWQKFTTTNYDSSLCSVLMLLCGVCVFVLLIDL